MKTINTPANKARFAANYWGQNLLQYAAVMGNFDIDEDNISDHMFQDSFLSLRSISSLTDEEITTLCTIIGYDISKGYLKSKVLSLIDNDLHIGVLTSYAADYLRSIGVLIPWMDLSVEDIIEYGWAKINT